MLLSEWCYTNVNYVHLCHWKQCSTYFPISSFFISVFLVSISLINLSCVLIHFSRVRLFATLWTVACQAPLSMGFSTQEYWSGLLFSSPGDLSDSGIKPTPITSPALADGFFSTSTTWEACVSIFWYEWCLIFPYPFPFFQLPSQLQCASFFYRKEQK